MKIQCILKRKGGTRASIDGIEYHFKPQEDGAHVADVQDNDHIQRFLSIPEGYRIYGNLVEPDAQDKDSDPDEDGDEDGDERAELVAEYEAKFGRKPNGKLSIENLRKKLEE